MDRSRSFEARRPPSYETYPGRADPYTIYGREIFMPRPNAENPRSFHTANDIDPRIQRHKSSAHPKEKKDSKSFKKLIYNFMGYTSAHGVGRLAESKTVFWKIFWSLVCMGAFGMFIYQGIGLLEQFISKPVSTTVSITFEKRISFPAVTICNLNMIRKDAMPTELKNALKNKLDYSWSATENSEEYRRRRNIQSSGGGPNPDTDIDQTSGDYNDDYYNDDEYADYRDDVEDYDSDYYDEEGEEEFPDQEELSLETRLLYEIDALIGGLNEDELYDDGHMFDTFIKNCTWKGIDCKSGNLSKYWTRVWDYKYGNCFTFNRGVDREGKSLRVLKATKPGPSQGLLLQMDIEQEQYIGPLSPDAGVRVLLHGQGQMIFPYEEGFSVSPGVSTSVGIKKTVIIRLDRFNNKSCLPANELPATNIYRRFRNITTYSQQACLNSCLGLSQRIRCKCSENAFPSDKREPCDVFDEKTSKCLRTVKYLFNNDKLSCLNDCRQPCEEEVIQKTISSSQWPSKAYKDYLISKKEYQNESDNLLSLNVFFNELNYEKIEEKFSYGTINLLADIGGQLGLWIGISVITVMELLELIAMFFTVCVKKINDASDIHDVPAYG